VILSMHQSEPDVPSFEERVALLERQSNLRMQAFDYLTQLRLENNLTLEDQVTNDNDDFREWKSDCEDDGNSSRKLSDDEFDPSADEFDPDSIPPSSASAEEKPVFRHKQVFRHTGFFRRIEKTPVFRLPDYDTTVPRPPHYEHLYDPMLGSAPAAEEGFSGNPCRCKECCALSPGMHACAGFSGPEYDPEQMPLRTAWAKLAAALLRRPSA
jgi:hypothetical protein